jgi:ankyrin repeat protein
MYCVKLLVGSELPVIVQRMLELGAHVNDRDDEGHTPLHLAVKANRYNYVKELINRGADIMVRISSMICFLIREDFYI